MKPMKKYLLAPFTVLALLLQLSVVAQNTPIREREIPAAIEEAIPVRSLPAAATLDPIRVVEFKLENGLTVMLTENHNTPEVFGAVVVNTGGKNDPANNTGMAHYLEHMLFKGTQKMGTIDYSKEKPFLDKIVVLYDSLGVTKDDAARAKIQLEINKQSVEAAKFAIPNEFDKILQEMGATNTNAFTTDDITAYFNSFPSTQIKQWLTIYSDRFVDPVFRLFQSELEAVYEEKNKGMDNTFNVVFETFQKNFFKVHPYGQQTVIGEVDHLKNPSLTAMYNYFNSYYKPNNMALVISGDIDIQQIKPMIQKLFGRWKAAEIPKFPIEKYQEKPFNGRELVEVNITPIKVMILGFRSPNNSHEDKLAMEVITRLLSNSSQTGLIDKLQLDGKVMAASAFELEMNDYGEFALFAAPKIIGQSLEEVEAIVLAELKKLGTGDFSESLLNSTKKEILQEIELGWESNQTRALEMGAAFSMQSSWRNYVSKSFKINQLTKDDIQRVAAQYLGDNYLCMYSKMGFPKKEKLEKPAFEPVVNTNEMHSEYRKSLEQLKVAPNYPEAIDFNSIERFEMGDNVLLRSSKNPMNSIFDLELEFGTGSYNNKLLQYLPDYLNMLGTKDGDVNKLKNQFALLGASYSFDCKQDVFTLSVRGRDENFEETVKLVGLLLNNLKPDAKKLDKLRDDIEGEKKLERNDPVYMGRVLDAYILFGEKSPYKNQLTKAEMKALTAEELMTAYSNALNFAVTINYIGNLPQKTVHQALIPFFEANPESPRLTANPKVFLTPQLPSTPTVYVLDNKRAVQSQIYFNQPSKAFDKAELPYINGFNYYFGDDMSSIVFQEIREFRSLAYTAYARYQPAPISNGNNRFFGYVACQDDKTMDAVAAMYDLIKTMPVKAERWSAIQNSILYATATAKPGFRSFIDAVDGYNDQGFASDPNPEWYKTVSSATFDDVLKFYTNEISSKPTTIVVLGNTKRFDTKALSKYGTVIKVKESSLFVN